MVAPNFYNEEDQEIYQGGDHFITQEPYRGAYRNIFQTGAVSQTPGASGITNTSVARPLILPPDGSGGDINYGNKFNLNMDTLKTIDMGRWQEAGGPANMYPGTYVKDSRKIAQDKHGNWKDIETNKNVYHGNINIKTPMSMVLDKFSGKKTTDDPYKGTWTGAEWDDELDPTIAGKNLNTYQRWKAKKEFKDAQDQKIIDKAAIQKGTQSAAGETYNRGTFTGDHPDTPTKTPAEGGWHPGVKDGGRIGLYAGGDPEEPAEDIREVMQDQNIPFSEQVEGEGDILSMLVAKYIEAGFPPDQAEEMAMQELQQMSADSGQGEGIAGLV